jgi:ATP-dependent Lon protease
MIKMIFAGIWVCVITLGAAYGAFQWQANQKPDTDAKSKIQKEAVKTRMISVPIIMEGALQGYVMAQLTFTVDAKINKEMAIKPQEYLLDEAFKVIYSDGGIDFRNAKKQDLVGITTKIAQNTNTRLGQPLVEDVLIQELNYLPKEQTRGGNKR